MKKGTEPAFPISVDIINMCGEKPNPFGMSTRLYLSGMLLQGMLSNTEFIKANARMAIENKKHPDSFLSETALSLADELIKQEEETR